ncbi:Na+/H+-dicarboxylate symporter [Bradyrhizobium ottawaense]
MSGATSATVDKKAVTQKKPFYRVLYVQVLAAIVLGIIVGWVSPELGKNEWIKAMGDGFVKLIKMVIAPIIFCTVVSGIAPKSRRSVGSRSRR